MKRLIGILLLASFVFTGCGAKLPEFDEAICYNFKFDEAVIKNTKEETDINGNKLVTETDKKDRTVRETLYNKENGELIRTSLSVYGSDGEKISKHANQPFEESGHVAFSYLSRDKKYQKIYNYRYLSSGDSYIYAGYNTTEESRDGKQRTTTNVDTNGKEYKMVVQRDDREKITAVRIYKDGVIYSETEYTAYPTDGTTITYKDGKKYSVQTIKNNWYADTQFYDDDGNLTDTPAE